MSSEKVTDALAQIPLATEYARFAWKCLKQRPAMVREIRWLYDATGDWWTIKEGLEELKRMGLAEAKDNVWDLTTFGKKVRDVQRNVALV
ncbi:unnamed protein product [marine sediment metagenome]|uniref:Uncharacterized protein n=1 Tax=marine sediment metagenome TaxID=412755 RepID=X1UIZ2_9ZZZZ